MPNVVLVGESQTSIINSIEQDLIEKSCKLLRDHMIASSSVFKDNSAIVCENCWNTGWNSCWGMAWLAENNLLPHLGNSVTIFARDHFLYLTRLYSSGNIYLGESCCSHLMCIENMLKEFTITKQTLSSFQRGDTWLEEGFNKEPRFLFRQ